MICPAWDLPREVLPACVMCAQPRAGVCANVTSFDLEMTEDMSVRKTSSSVQGDSGFKPRAVCQHSAGSGHPVKAWGSWQNTAGGRSREEIGLESRPPRLPPPNTAVLREVLVPRRQQDGGRATVAPAGSSIPGPGRGCPLARSKGGTGASQNPPEGHVSVY